MAGSTLMIAATLANAAWAGLLWTVRPSQLTAPTQRYRGMDSALALLTVPLMLVSGACIDKWGVQTVLLLGGCLAALALLGLDRGDSLASALGATALLASGVAALTVGSVVLMPQAFFPRYTARSVNLGFLAVACGVVLGRPITQGLSAKIGLRKTQLALALISLLPAAAVACAFMQPAESDQPSDSTDLMVLLADPHLYLQLAIAVLCFPLEAAIGPWARRYTGDLGFLPGSAVVIGIGFWTTFLGARLLAGLFLPSGGEATLILILAILAAVTFGNMLGAYAPAGSSSLGLWLTGACCGALVPTLLGMVLRTQSENAALAVGMTFAAGMLGNLLVLRWIDASAPEHSTRTTMAGALTLTVVLLAPALVLAVLG